MTRTLEGKRVLVTGGSRGLGAAMVRAFARHGARVAFSWHKHADAAEATRAAAGEHGAEVRAFLCDVLDEAETSRMVATLAKDWGGLDVLVNNAGMTQNLPLPLLEVEDFDRVMRVNVTGSYIAARAAARVMIRQKAGLIVSVGSLAGERALDAPIHYCASKAALSGMTRALSKELSRHGVRAICLAPGLLEDGVGNNIPEHRRADYLAHVALARIGTLDEVAELAVFLASDAASYVNGETIVCDGGV